jgi:hypothetical protein
MIRCHRHDDQELNTLFDECRERTNEQDCRRTSLLNGAMTRPLGYCARAVLTVPGDCAAQMVLGYYVALTLIKNQRRYSTNAISELTKRASYSIASLRTYQLGQRLDQLRREDTKIEVLRPC